MVTLLTFGSFLGATGIHDVAPTAADAPVMLEAGRPGFGVFADFDGPAEGRLVVSIGDASEVLYIALAPEYRDNGNPYSSDNFSRYRFRIRQITDDGTNPIVHGPFTIDNNNANVNSYAEAVFGSYEVGNQQFGDSIFLFRPEAAGDYSIEFDEFTNDGSARVNIPFWDFTVVNSAGPVPGRVWSRGWAFRTPQVNGDVEPDCVWDREFNGNLYSYTDDGFVSRIDFNNSGFQGLSFNMAFNEKGPGNTGDLATDRQSVPGINATGNAAQHRIFLVEPDINLFPDGICGTVTAGETFLCGDTDPYCLEVTVTRPGQVDILLDFDGNGILDGNSQDVLLIYEFTAGDLSTCVPWDGLRGDTTPVDFTDTVDVIINYSQGIQHWSAYDVEFMKNGFCVTTVRPTCGTALTSDELYWDDREIPQEPGTGAPKDNRSGDDCSEEPRTWNNFILNSDQCDDFDDALTEGYGDKNTLNTWWVANSVSEFKARVPVVSAVITGGTSLCTGDTTTLVAVDQGLDGAITYDWSGPGVDTATTESVRAFLSGQYCVLISDDLGCSSETCVEIIVLDFEADQFPGILETCFGDTVRLMEPANPDFTYSWTPALGISSTSSNDPFFFPEVTTIYTATITGASSNGQVCEVTEQVTVTVFPEIGLQVTGGGPICEETTVINASTITEAEVVLFDPMGNPIGSGTEFTVPVSGEADYVLVATNDQGCTETAVFTVSGGPVNVSLPDTLLTCLSDGVNLSVTNLDANDTLTYVWTPANIFTPESVNTANPVFNGPQGDYNANVVITNQYGCTVSEDVQLIVIDDSGILSFESEVDCDGSTVSFTNTSTVSFGYVYDFGDGTTSNEANPTHVYDVIGTYTVTLDLVYDQVCVASVTQEVTTFPILVDAALSVDFGDCDNGSASLTFTDESFNATGAELTYNWTFTGVLPAVATTSPATVTITESGEVTATLEVISADGCTATVDTTFTVNLAVVNLAEEITICPGDSTALNPGADESLIYSWSPAEDFDPGTANPTTSLPGTYVVTVTSNSADFNCTNTDTVTVVIPDSIGLVVNGPDGPFGEDGTGGVLELPTQQTCGEAVDLMVELNVNDDVVITYTDLNGNVLGMGGTLTVSPNGSDTIVVTAVNRFGCVEMDTVVIINNQVDAGINVGANGVSFCSATDTVISVLNFDPTDELMYAWEDNDIINGPLDGESVDITSPVEGTVDLMVLVTNQFGCDTMITVPVTAVPFLPNTFPDTIRPCFGDDFVIEGGDAVVGYTYEWTPADDLDLSDPANPVGNFTEDTELTVVITDPVTGCNQTETIVVDVAPEIAFGVDPAVTNICGTGMVTIEGSTVNDDVIITWYNDPELTDEAGTGPTFTINADMMGETYTIYGEAVDPNTGCRQTQSATVNTTAFTPNQYPPVITPCFDEAFTIEGGDAVAGYVYEWTPNDNLDLSDPANPVGTWTENGMVTVTITDPETGCTETQQIDVEVAPEISFMTSPSDTTLCEPAMVTVGGSSVNGNVEIVWFSDAELTMEIGQGSTITIDAAETGQSYTVFGVATDPTTGCRQVVPATVTVSELTAGLPLDNVAACFGETPDIFGADGPSGTLEYSYEPADLVDATDPANPVFTGTSSAEVTITVTDPATGCTAERVVSFDITNITDLTGTASPDTILLGETSTLEVLGCDDCDYEWFPQDGTVSPTTGSTVTATPDEEGDYIYEVEVTQNGCMEVVEIELRVDDPICDPDNIFVPNAFTPNGDNMNDVMRVRSKFADQLTEFRFIIHNRWGQEVYESSDINDSWDGTSEGDDLEPDVYGYWLRVVCPAGEELIQQGNITILR